MEELELLYNEIYKEDYCRLEKLRKRSKQKYENVYILIALFIIEGLLFKINIDYGVIFLLVMLIVLVILIIKSSIMFKGEDTYDEVYQNNVIGPLIQLYDENLKYTNDKGLDLTDFEKIEKIRPGHVYRFSNLIESEINNVNIKASQIANIYISRSEHSGKKVFEGIFVKINYKDMKNKIDLIESTKNKVDTICRDGNLEYKIEITNDAIYLLFSCGNIFRGNIFESSLKKETVYNAYNTIKEIFDISKEIANRILI